MAKSASFPRTKVIAFTHVESSGPQQSIAWDAFVTHLPFLPAYAQIQQISVNCTNPATTTFGSYHDQTVWGVTCSLTHDDDPVGIFTLTNPNYSNANGNFQPLTANVYPRTVIPIRSMPNAIRFRVVSSEASYVVNGPSGFPPNAQMATTGTGATVQISNPGNLIPGNAMSAGDGGAATVNSTVLPIFTISVLVQFVEHPMLLSVS